MDKILIIEDDETIKIGLKYYLEQESFEVILASTKEEAKEQVKKHMDTSLILLDVNLPDGDGFSLFKEIKAIKDIPIIFLTANDFETSIVMGIDMGAEDYITKPFKARELTSRIRAVLRRNKKTETSSLIQIQNITIDMNQAKVMRNNKDVFLTALEYKILLIFALNPNTVFTREQILASIWDVEEEYVNDNTLTVYIKRIRQKIEEDPANPKIIQTIRKVGYKLGDENA